MKLPHNHKGNCWDPKLVTKPGCSCDPRTGGDVDQVICHRCHKHDQPRGECTLCFQCPACEAAALDRHKAYLRALRRTET